MITLAILRLHWTLASTRALLWIARAGGADELRPEVHAYLADVHFRLAAAYETAGKRMKAARHRKIANAHAVLGPPDDLPPAQAAVMGLPHAWTFTDARGKWHDPSA